LTTSPPDGAAPLSVTVPVDPLPPTTVEGDTTRLVGTAGVIVSVVDAELLPSVAVIVALMVLATAVVVIAKVVELEPEGTVTLVGAEAFELLDESPITMPAAGAAPLRVTIPVEVDPPVTDLGETETPVGTGGVTVSVAGTDVLPREAVMVTGVVDGTATVVIVNVTEEVPAGIVTVPGGFALVLLEERLTVAPPGGAGSLSVSVPVLDVPPMTELGETVRVLGTGGVRVTIVETDVEPTVAVIVAGVDTETSDVAIEKVVDVAPAGTVTVAGTVALLLFEVRLTRAPPVDAAPVRVTVPVDCVPPWTLLGEAEMLAGTGGMTVRFAVLLPPPDFAVITAVTLDRTGLVVIVNVALVAPDGTVTTNGTTTDASPLLMATSFPPLGAAADSVTVPVEVDPLGTVDGLIEKPLIGTVFTCVPSA